MITDKEHTNEGRNELLKYTTFIKRIEECKLKIEEINTKINKVASGSPKKLPEGKGNDEDWRSPLYEEIDKLNKRRISYEVRMDNVHEFIHKLSQKDKLLIDKLFLRNMKSKYIDLCEEYGYTASGLRDYVNSLIKKYWLT